MRQFFFAAAAARWLLVSFFDYMILLCWKVHIWKYGLTYRKWSLDDCQIKCWSFSVEREHYRMVNWPCYKTFTQKLPPARHRRLLPPKIEWQSNGLAHACMWWVIVVDLVFHLCLCVSVCAMPLIRIVGICCCCCYWFEWREKKAKFIRFEYIEIYCAFTN